MIIVMIFAVEPELLYGKFYSAEQKPCFITSYNKIWQRNKVEPNNDDKNFRYEIRLVILWW